jgi:hypothetical protein
MRNNKLQSTKLRAILSGNELEIYEYEDPVWYNFSAERKIATANDLSSPEENRIRSRHRSKKMIQHLIDANFGMWMDEFGHPYVSKFLTLTYAANILRPEETNPEFTLFIKRLNYQLFKSKCALLHYLVVIEFQKRGAVHYHIVIFNLPYMDLEQYQTAFEKAWGHGIVHIRTVPDRGVGKYITKKYITKSDDIRLWGNKSYFASRGILKPIVIRNEAFVRTLLFKLPDDAKKFSMPYMSEHTGLSEYKSYSLRDYPDLLKRILANIPKPDTFKAKA